MDVALGEASATLADVPVGSVLIDSQGEVVGASRNSRELDKNLIGHAEVNVVLEAWGRNNLGTLDGFTLVTTLEPCLLCASIIRETRISRVVYGAPNPQRGAAGSVYDLLRDDRLGNPIEVIGGIRAEECQRLLNDFFCRIRTGGH